MDLLGMMLDESPDHSFMTKFWPAYPRRDGKKDALKAWKKICPDSALVLEIVSALAWQSAAWSDRESKFIMLPATYLRGERWKDTRPIPPKPKVVMTRFASLGFDPRYNQR